MFLNDSSSIYALKEAGIITGPEDVAFASKRDITSECEKDYSVYVGYTYSEIKKYILHRRRNGHRVATYDISTSGYDLFKCSDVSITADSSTKTFPDTAPVQINSYVSSGNLLSDDGSQILRLFSDVAIPRSDVRSGGVSSIYNAFLNARNIIKNIIFAVSYLLCSQIARMSFVVPSLACGAKTVRAEYILLFSAAPVAPTRRAHLIPSLSKIAESDS